MPGAIFWDVDTQYDFMMPDGKLYVGGSETILTALERLTAYARRHGIPIFGSIDYHTPHDPEISNQPDFMETFPPHCLQGTPGCEKVPATTPLNPLWIDSHPCNPSDLLRQVQGHAGEVVFRKQRFDVFTNPNVDTVLDAVSPGRIVVYGVALDVCDAYAVEGFLSRKRGPIFLVENAARAIRPERGEELIADWRRRGVRIVRTADVVDHGILER